MAKNANYSRVGSSPEYLANMDLMKLNGTGVFVGGVESIVGKESVYRMSNLILDTSFTSVVLDKENPIWPKMNMFYLKMKESGIFDQFKEKYWYQTGKREYYKPRKTKSGEPMTLTSIASVMIVLTVGLVPAIAAFIFELMIN